MNGRGRPVCLNIRERTPRAWRALNRIAGRFVLSAGDPVRGTVWISRRSVPPSPSGLRSDGERLPCHSVGRSGEQLLECRPRIVRYPRLTCVLE